jgi:putative sigma-54 modulation protein
MNVTFRSHHTSIDSDLKEHAEKKLARLERYLPRVDDITVEVTREETRAASQRCAVQITVRSGGSILRGEERAAEPQAAFDRAAEVISRQAQRHKKRLDGRRHSGASKELVSDMANAAPAGSAPESDVADYVEGDVVRVKRFDAKPMSQEEALAQMDLLGHDFFLFLDRRTNEFAVLYKRKDGHFGLLSPDRT